MITMQWKLDDAGRIAAQWTKDMPKKARHFHKTARVALKARLRKTWRK